MIVFLVDDDQEDHEIFKMAFERADPNTEIHTAENGMEAIEYLQKDKGFMPDIIFLDVNMPKMNGKDCIRQLRKLEHLQNVPMILYSTHDGQKEIDEAKEAGANGFITKPSSISEYTKVLQTVIAKHIKIS